MATGDISRRKETFIATEGQRHQSPIPTGVKAGGFVYLSAVLPVNPISQDVASDDPEAQVRQVFENIQAALKVAGATMGDVVKVGIYMRDLSERSALNKVWLDYFPTEAPARFAVQVVDLGGPGGKSRFMADVTALAP